MYHISQLPSSSYKTVLKNHLAWNFLQCSSECEANLFFTFFATKEVETVENYCGKSSVFIVYITQSTKRHFFTLQLTPCFRVLRIGRRSWILIYMYCGIIPIRGGQCSWIIYTLLVRGDVMSVCVTGLLHYNAGQFITFWNIRGDINSWER